jgi:hypothetical protein
MKTIGFVVVIGGICLTVAVLGGFMSFEAPKASTTSKGQAAVESARGVVSEQLHKVAEGVR